MVLMAEGATPPSSVMLLWQQCGALSFARSPLSPPALLPEGQWGVKPPVSGKGERSIIIPHVPVRIHSDDICKYQVLLISK